MKLNDWLSQPGLIETVQIKFPKFSRIQVCMIRNREYGIWLSPEAERQLLDAGFELPYKKRPTRKKNTKKRVGASLDIDLYSRAKERAGNKTMQEYIETLIKEDLK